MQRSVKTWQGSIPRAQTVCELFRFGVYKRSQGRIARQVTFAAMRDRAVASGLWQL